MKKQDPKGSPSQFYHRRQLKRPDSLDVANKRKAGKSPSPTKAKGIPPTAWKVTKGSCSSGFSDSSSKRPDSRGSLSPSPSPTTYFYTVRFPEGLGYLFLRSILVGAQSDASLVLGEKDGQTYMQKARKDDGKGNYLPSMEIEFAKKLKSNGVVPKAWAINEETVGDKRVNSAIFEYCNGRDLESYYKDNAQDPNIEVLIWHVIAEMVKIIAFLQTGVLIGGAKPEGAKRVKKRKIEEPEVKRGWRPIFHKDHNMGNILLDFPIAEDGDSDTNLPLPKVLLGDCGLAEYKPKEPNAPSGNDEFASFSNHLGKFLVVLVPRRGRDFSKALVDCVQSFKDKKSDAYFAEVHGGKRAAIGTRQSR